MGCTGGEYSTDRGRVVFLPSDTCLQIILTFGGFAHCHSLSLSIHPSTQPPINLSIHLFVHPSILPSIHPPTHPSFHTSSALPVLQVCASDCHLFIYLPCLSLSILSLLLGPIKCYLCYKRQGSTGVREVK